MRNDRPLNRAVAIALSTALILGPGGSAPFAAVVDVAVQAPVGTSPALAVTPDTDVPGTVPNTGSGNLLGRPASSRFGRAHPTLLPAKPGEGGRRLDEGPSIVVADVQEASIAASDPARKLSLPQTTPAESVTLADQVFSRVQDLGLRRTGNGVAPSDSPRLPTVAGYSWSRWLDRWKLSRLERRHIHRYESFYEIRQAVTWAKDEKALWRASDHALDAYSQDLELAGLALKVQGDLVRALDLGDGVRRELSEFERAASEAKSRVGASSPMASRYAREFRTRDNDFRRNRHLGDGEFEHMVTVQETGDVAGVREIRERLDKLEEALKDTNLYPSSGLRPPSPGFAGRRVGNGVAPAAPEGDGAKKKKEIPESEKAYLRANISKARFGDAERQKLLTNAYHLRERINKVIIGQDEAAKAMQDRLVQYLENVGTRTKDPVALHLIGLPGIGKSAMLDVLEGMGIAVLRIDAQRYVRPSVSFAADLDDALDEFLKDEKNKGRPLILVIEELDKVPEKGGRAALLGPEITNSMIGTLNQVLTDGKLPSLYPFKKPLDLSNLFVVTTMNFAPADIERFSKEALGAEKSFYDFTHEDFAKHDQWIRSESSARYKVLSRLFRPNTVSRLAPNMVMLKSLSGPDYRKIAELTLNTAIQRATTGANSAKRLTVTATTALIDFLARRTTYAPSGARETIYRADALSEQLINYGVKAVGGDSDSLDRPRRIELDFDAEAMRAVITVTPRLRDGKVWRDSESFRLNVSFDEESGFFQQPDGLALKGPKQPEKKEDDKDKKATPVPEKPVFKKQIIAARFPKTQNAARGLAEKIDRTLIGQEQFTKIAEREMNVYLGRLGPARKEPSTLVLAGFPGIGKSELASQTARQLGLPIIRVNMQAFSSDSPNVVEDFLDTVLQGIAKAKEQKAWNGKYVLLLEELDKVYELDAEGKQKNRPVMALIKDLLNDGQGTVTTRKEWNPVHRSLDVRDGFLFVTMNFAVDRFGFEADPRLTNPEDVIEAWKHLTTRLADMKNVMGSMFLPETVSRLMSRLHIMAPLDAASYRKVIDLQAKDVVRERLFDKEGKNFGLIDLRLTPAYRDYLFSETVVPSEGPRHTSVASRIKISADLETALKSLKRSADYADKPVTIVLDYKPGKSEVVGSVVAKDVPGAKPVEVFRQGVALFFPSLRARGRIEEKRLKTAVHEFGHAYVGVRLGLRIDYATVVSPKDGIGGLVKWKDESQSAKAFLAHTYASLASRAMERIFLSPEPLASASVLDITTGPSQDIKSATKRLFDMLHELGMDPDGGTMDRLGIMSVTRYANFSDLPPEEAERLGRILREMENFIVKDLLEANPREWYVEKISRFAREGGMSEGAFYKLLGYPDPGTEKDTLGEVSLLREHFKHVIAPLPADAKAAAAFRQGSGRTTPAENLDAYKRRFLEILQEHVPARAAAGGPSAYRPTAFPQNRPGNGVAPRGPEKSQRRKADFVAEVAHELRTPLTAIKGALFLLRDSLSGDDARLLKLATDNVERMAQLIEETLDLAKGQAAGWKVDPKPTAPSALLKTAAETVGTWARRQQVTLTLEAAASLPAVAADEKRAAQVLVNLLSNAVKFSSPGSAIAVRAAPDAQPGFVRFSVTDQGPGMTTQELQNLFGRFVQFRNGQKVGGTGLGLSIAKGFVEAQGGRIWAESEPGKGTTFHFTLPISP